MRHQVHVSCLVVPVQQGYYMLGRCIREAVNTEAINIDSWSLGEDMYLLH
jgi:hypothetical protein